MTDSLKNASDLEGEVRYWRNVAIYLADCHAATAYDYEPKSVSKSKRDRIIGLLETCMKAMNKHPNKCGDHPRSEKDVSDRCLSVMTRLHEANERKKHERFR